MHPDQQRKLVAAPSLPDIAQLTSASTALEQRQELSDLEPAPSGVLSPSQTGPVNPGSQSRQNMGPSVESVSHEPPLTQSASEVH